MKNAVVNTSSGKGVLTTVFLMLLLEKECCPGSGLCSFWKRSAVRGQVYAPFGKGVLSGVRFMLLLEKECCPGLGLCSFWKRSADYGVFI